jgi:transcriptional regulator GlxA family with amidase domain
MKIAMLLFDRFTALDVIGPYEVLSRLPGADLRFVAERRGEVRSDTGRLGITADLSFDEFREPDVIVVPGGPGSDAQLTNPVVHQWLRLADEHSTWTTSACTGSLILGAAGLLDGRAANSHWLARDQLRRFGAEPAEDRVVVDGKYVTAAGVSAGIDMALTLFAEIAGKAAAQRVQLFLEYDPRPPFNAGSEHTAPAEVVDALRSASRFS